MLSMLSSDGNALSSIRKSINPPTIPNEWQYHEPNNPKMSLSIPSEN